MKPRLLASAATAAAIAVAAPSASALTLNVNGSQVQDAQDVARALGQAAGSSLRNGATVNVGGYKVVFDPRSLGTQLSDAFDPATGEHRVRAQRGRPADGRAVATPAVGIFTSGFGPRWGRMHQGIDIANISGTPIYAAMDGTVAEAGPASGFGNWVVIRHDGGEVTVYGHMRDYSVTAGQRVKAGQQIAAIGNEGESTGPHLHFEVKPDGVTPNDPVAWFKQQGITI
ncbi:M23 family metallopeptidase [Corynebacterium bouchesdurhonense]|uniref:M23 family metallopeptidase n=1 Tax=Corynebacterium bouchesdurhonense TaxID=1720192 RepID=UPI0008352433|nr:M23 family metallopeptidase [Corynebacterium bouchesdurhonense]